MVTEILFLLAHATPDHDLLISKTSFKVFNENSHGWFCTDSSQTPTFVKRAALGIFRDYRKDREGAIWTLRENEEKARLDLEAHMRKLYKKVQVYVGDPI